MPLSPPEAGHDTRPWAAPGFLAAAVVGTVLSFDIASGGPILVARWGILARLGIWVVAWAAAVLCAFRAGRRAALGAIFLAALALRLGALAGPPVLSDDLYRYAWDGRVQAAGVNPYRHPPDAPELAALREPWLWPTPEGCTTSRPPRPPGCTRINRESVRTIYPPLAQAWFAVVYRIAGIDDRHKAWQVAGMAGDMVLVGLLPVVLRAWGRDERWTALYALSPLPVLEVVNSAHLDGLAAVFVVGALLAAARRRPAWAGALVGAAALVKLYPLILLAGLVVAVAAGRKGWLRRAAVPVATAAAVVAAGYLPHVAAVGVRVLGYLPGYLREENYATGGRYLLAGLLGLPKEVTTLLVVAGLGAVVAWVLRRRPPAPVAFALLLGALLLATTPVQPWYAVTLLAVATVAAGPWWSVLAVAAYPYFFAVILDLPHAVAVGRLSYGAAFVAAAVAYRRPGRRGAPAEGDESRMTGELNVT